MRPENLKILATRWPEVARHVRAARLGAVDVMRQGEHAALVLDGIRLESLYAARAEALLQASLVPPEAKAATLYGLAQGSLARVLLERPGLTNLRVVLLSESAALASMTFFDHSDWLADQRVEVALPGEKEEPAYPMAVATGELVLAGDVALPLRDRIELVLSAPFHTRSMDEREEEFAANLRKNLPLVRADADVAELFQSLPGGTVHVAAAGPTLEDHYDRLRASSAPLIAVDATLQSLLAAEIIPDIVVTQDSLASGMARVFDVSMEALRRTRLVYFPVVPAAVMERWQGPRSVAYGAHERYASLRASDPRGALWSSGSVLHPAVDLAVQMGARRIELFGADFATPRGRSHVRGFPFERTVRPAAHLPEVLDGHGRRVVSMPNLIGYLRDLEQYIESLTDVEFLNASRDGARIRGAAYEHAIEAA